MDNLTQKVALITGGASGIGRSLAARFCQAGMNVVISDIEKIALEKTVSELQANGANALGFLCDVSDHSSVADLREQTLETFGLPHVLCLNAGVAPSGLLTESPIEDWKWALNVNLGGIIHGLDIFLKELTERDEGHIVITASIAGHYPFPGLAPYNATKYGAISIAETLYLELRNSGSKVGVTCLCPGLVATNIFTSERNRPNELHPKKSKIRTDEESELYTTYVKWMQKNGTDPSKVAEMTHQAVLDNTFWLFTDDDYLNTISERHSAIEKREQPPEHKPTTSVIDF